VRNCRRAGKEKKKKRSVDAICGLKMKWYEPLEKQNNGWGRKVKAPKGERECTIRGRSGEGSVDLVDLRR